MSDKNDESDNDSYYDFGRSDPTLKSKKPQNFSEVSGSEESSSTEESEWEQPDPFREPDKSGREKYEEQPKSGGRKKDTSGVLSRPSAWHNSSQGIRHRLKDSVLEFAEDYLDSGKSINRPNVEWAANRHFGNGHPHDSDELVELLNELS